MGLIGTRAPHELLQSVIYCERSALIVAKATLAPSSLALIRAVNLCRTAEDGLAVRKAMCSINELIFSASITSASAKICSIWSVTVFPLMNFCFLACQFMVTCW